MSNWRGSMDSAGNVENWNRFNRDRDYSVYEYRYFTVSEVLLSLNSLKAKTKTKQKQQQETKQPPSPQKPHTLYVTSVGDTNSIITLGKGL